MTRLLLAGAAALVLTSGTALAQSSYSQSTTVESTTTPVQPSVDSTTKSVRSKTYNSDGTETVQSKTYSLSNGGAVNVREHSHTVAPDGSVLNSTDTERTTTPGVGETTTRTTTTTIDR